MVIFGGFILLLIGLNMGGHIPLIATAFGIVEIGCSLVVGEPLLQLLGWVPILASLLHMVLDGSHDVLR